MQKDNVFNLLRSEYKNRDYKSIIRYAGSNLFAFCMIVLTVLMIHMSSDNFTTNLAIFCFLGTLFLSFHGLCYEKSFLKKATTKQIKKYLADIVDEDIRIYKAKQIVSLMAKNENMSISIGQLNEIKRYTFNVLDNITYEYEEIIQNLLEKDRVNYKVKQEVLLND